MKKIFPLLLISLFTFQSLQAYHLIGTQLRYEYLGNNDYKLVLKVYRDCSNALAGGFDDPLFLTIFLSNDLPFQNLTIPFSGATGVVELNCSSFPFDTCLESTEYNITVNLPPVNGRYFVVYQRCCRNNVLSNIIAPAGTGVTAWVEINESALISGNSSPVLPNYPASVICLGQPYEFNYNASDPDGDSLVFHLATPFGGASDIYPQPQPPPPPPYPLVYFASPYTYLEPLGPASPISIDSVTGLLQVTPAAIGVYLVGVQIDEYRSGTLLSSTVNDFEFIVTENGVGVHDPDDAPSFQIFQDLNSDMMNIFSPSGEKFSVSIFDALGRESLHGSSPENKFQFSTSSLPTGIYLAVCTDEKRKILHSEKIVIGIR